MGWEDITHEDVARSIQREFAQYLVDKPLVKRKGAATEIELRFKRKTPLKAMTQSVGRIQGFAMGKKAPTRIIIKVSRNGKMHKIVVPVATKGMKGGKPSYPYFSPIGMPLHVAPEYPRKGSVNPREIAGQYLAVFLARQKLRPQDAMLFTASDVSVEVMRQRGSKREIEKQSDIDLFHLREVRAGKRRYYELMPVEVTTSHENIKKKMDIWEETIEVLRRMANAEKTDLAVRPLVIYVKSPGRDNHKNAIESLRKTLQAKFPEGDVIVIESRAKSNGKNLVVKGEYGHVEYIEGALKNIAKLPEKYHTDLVSAVLKNFEDLKHLKTRFNELAALRKIWRMRSIEEGVKHYITDRYAEYATHGHQDALLSAMDDAMNRFAEHRKTLLKKRKEILKALGGREAI